VTSPRLVVATLGSWDAQPKTRCSAIKSESIAREGTKVALEDKELLETARSYSDDRLSQFGGWERSLYLFGVAGSNYP